DVAEAEHRGAVADDRDQVAARGVLPALVLVLSDLQARLGDAGAVGEAEVPLGVERLGGDHLELPGATLPVVLERVLLAPAAALLLLHTSLPLCLAHAGWLAHGRTLPLPSERRWRSGRTSTTRCRSCGASWRGGRSPR